MREPVGSIRWLLAAALAAVAAAETCSAIGLLADLSAALRAMKGSRRPESALGRDGGAASTGRHGPLFATIASRAVTSPS